MKNTTLSILFSIFTVVVFSQVRLGATVSEIRNEFWEDRYNLKSGYSDDIYYISIETERALVIYYFDKDNICKGCMIAPDNQGALNFYVELYNRLYFIVSSTKWKMYSEEGIANIELVYPEDGSCFFMWY